MQKNVLVLYGGSSNEREVSLASGKNVAERLQSAGYKVELSDTAEAGFNLVAACNQADVVIPMLHGAGGEDGLLQQELDTLGVRYLGSGAEACKLTFDKVSCKERLGENGVLTPPWEVVDKKQFIASPLRRQSYVLKPIAGGSTIDTLIVHNPEHHQIGDGAINNLFGKYKRMLLEELIEGQEITVGILGDDPLPVIHIIPPEGEEFDYTNKYNGKTHEVANPTDISRRLQHEAQRLAKRVHTLTGCRDLSRTDIIIDASGAMYVLEINTLPGMTAQSLLPKAALAVGISIDVLVTRFVDMAAEER